MAGNGQLSVPPGFRFHPTDEELLYYYLRKKVSYEPIDLDVIREVDLNKLEPWDLKDKCRIGSGPQNEWYFFSHKDKKYPTGTRTNRATTAGFWKATGRDKAIHLSSSRRIGMRKTLVFYTGRAPHGQKTEWIMHEYRLDDENADHIQEDGWVVCRVFKKKNHTRGYHPEFEQEEPVDAVNFNAPNNNGCILEQKLENIDQALYNHHHHHPFDHHHNNSMHLPQLLSPESTIHTSYLLPLVPLSSSIDVHGSQSLLKLTTPSNVVGSSSSGGYGGLVQNEKISGDWAFLDKLLATHQTMDQFNKNNQFSQVLDLAQPAAQRFSSFPAYQGFHEPDFSRYSK